MPQNDYIYSAGLDAGDIYAELKKIDTTMKSLGKDGANAFNQIEREAQQAGSAVGNIGNQAGQLKQQFGQLGGVLQQIGGNTSIGQLGTAIGVVSGGVQALTAKLIEMAAQAVASFNQIYNQSIQMNQEAESAQFLFQNLFGGDMAQAGALVNDLRQLAQVLGISSDAAFKFSQAIAPDSRDVGQLKTLITLADRFSDLENRPFEQLIFTFNEMVAGQFESAKDVLNLSPVAVKQIKAYQKELGNTEGIVKGLTEYLESRNLGVSSLDAMAGSAQQTQKSIAGIKSELQSALGEAPFQALKENQDLLSTFLSDNREALLEIAYAVGDILASFSRLGTSIKEAFAGEVDVSDVAEWFRNVANQITEINIKMETLFGFVSDVNETLGGDGWTGILDLLMPLDNVLEAAGQLGEDMLVVSGNIDKSGKATDAWAAGAKNLTDVMQGNIGVFDAINMALTTANQLLALIKAGWAGIIAGVKPFFDDMILAAGSVKALWDQDWERLSEINDQLAANAEKRGGGMFDQKAATDAFNESMLESVTAMNAAEQKTNDYYDTLEERRARAESGALPDDTALPGANTGNGPSEEYIKAEEKINKKMEDLARQHTRRMADIINDYHNKQADAAKDAARKREDIERNYQRSVEDINRKFAQQISEVSDFNQKEKEIANSHRQEQVSLERDYANERLNIEKDYQRQLQQIQNQYAQDSEEAARANNASAFLAARRQRNRAVEEATIDRDQKQADAAQEFAQRREALLAAQQQEIADAREAAQQKLADLREKMQEELEAAELKRQRDLEDAKIIEEQKSSDLDEQISRRVQAEIEANNERIADAQRALSKELELVQSSKNSESEIVKNAESQKQQAIQQTGAVAQVVANQSVQAWQTAGNAAMAAIARMQQANQQAQSMALNATTPYSQQSSVISRRMSLPGLEGISGRAFGGTVLSNRPYLVGERGPELFTPNQTGQITPNNRLMSSPAAFGMGGAVTYNQQRVDLSMLDPSQVSPAQRAAMRQEALAILAEL